MSEIQRTQTRSNIGDKTGLLHSLPGKWAVAYIPTEPNPGPLRLKHRVHIYTHTSYIPSRTTKVISSSLRLSRFEFNLARSFTYKRFIIIKKIGTDNLVCLYICMYWTYRKYSHLIHPYNPFHHCRTVPYLYKCHRRMPIALLNKVVRQCTKAV